MLRRLRGSGILLISAWLSASWVGASGFSIQELGARAAGMGGAFIAIADDGSALFYNPAGIAFQKGLRFQMDGFLVKGNFRFFPSATPPGVVVPADGYDGSVRPKVQFLGNLYLTADLTPKWTFGFGVFSPFGLGDNWTNFQDSDPPHEKFPARFAGTRGRIEIIWFQPTAAYRLTENSSLALGVAFVHTHVMLEQSFLNPLDDGLIFGEILAPDIFPGQDPVQAGRSIARLLPEGRARFAGTSQRPGFNAGFLYKHPASKTNFGLQYRSAVVHRLKGQASFAFTDGFPLEPFIGAETIPNLFPTQEIRGGFTTPASFSAGVSNSSFWDSTISVEFHFQDYQRFRDVALNFTQTEGTATPPEQRFSFDFENTFFLRAGFERRLGERTALRGGYYFDKSAVPEKSVGPFFPDSTKHVGTVGASRQFGNKELTIFYQGAKLRERVTDVPENAVRFSNGTYRTFIHLLGFGFRINLGGTTIGSDR